MILHAVWTLQRGVIDPPERIAPALEDSINAAMYAAARYELDPPMTDAEMWRLQGLTAGYIKEKIRRQREAA